MLILYSKQNIIPKPSSIADATDILGLVNNLKPSLRIAILHIADKRPPLSELPGALSTVRGDVISLKTSTVALINALIDATPVSLCKSYFPLLGKNLNGVELYSDLLEF